MAFSAIRSRSVEIRKLARGLDDIFLECYANVAEALSFETVNNRKVLTPVGFHEPNSGVFNTIGDPRLDEYADLHTHVAKSTLKIIAVYEGDDRVILASSSAFAVSPREAWTPYNSVRQARKTFPLARVHYTFSPADCYDAPLFSHEISRSAYAKLRLSRLPQLEVVHMKPSSRHVLRSPYTATYDDESSRWEHGYFRGGFDFAALRAPGDVFQSFLPRASQPPRVDDVVFVQGYPVGISSKLVMDYIDGLSKHYDRHRMIDSRQFDAFVMDEARFRLTSHFNNFRGLCTASGKVLAIDPDELLAASTTTCSGFSGGAYYNTRGEFVGIHLGGRGDVVKKAHNVALSAFYPTLDVLHSKLPIA